MLSNLIFYIEKTTLSDFTSCFNHFKQSEVSVNEGLHMYETHIDVILEPLHALVLRMSESHFSGNCTSAPCVAFLRHKSVFPNTFTTCVCGVV